MRALVPFAFCCVVFPASAAFSQSWEEVMAAAGPETSKLVMCSAILTLTGTTMAEAGLSPEDATARTDAGGTLSFGAGITRMGAFSEDMDTGLATAEAHAARLATLLVDMFPSGADMAPMTDQIAPCMAEAQTMDAVLKDALGE